MNWPGATGSDELRPPSTGRAMPLTCMSPARMSAEGWRGRIRMKAKRT